MSWGSLASECVRFHRQHLRVAQPSSSLLDLGTRESPLSELAWLRDTGYSLAGSWAAEICTQLGAAVRGNLSAMTFPRLPQEFEPTLLEHFHRIRRGNQSAQGREAGGGDTLCSGANRQWKDSVPSLLFLASASTLNPSLQAAKGTHLFFQIVGKNVCQGTLEPWISLVGDWAVWSLDLNS